MNTAAKRLVFGVLALGFMALPALGQETGESCAAIADDAQRLACYDAVFRSGPGEPAAAINLQSEQLIPARPSGRQPATLALACIEGAPEVRFAFAGQLMSATGDIAPLTLQVDQGPTQVRTMQAAEDNLSLSFSSDRDTAAFLDSLDGGTVLKVRMTPVRQRSLNVTFRVGAVLSEIAALRETCR